MLIFCFGNSDLFAVPLSYRAVDLEDNSPHWRLPWWNHHRRPRTSPGGGFMMEYDSNILNHDKCDLPWWNHRGWWWKYDGILWNIVKCEETWWIDDVWWSMMNYDKTCWNTMKYDDDELRTKYTTYLVVKVKKIFFFLRLWRSSFCKYHTHWQKFLWLVLLLLILFLLRTINVDVETILLTLKETWSHK